MSRLLVAVLIIACVASAIGVVYARHQHRLLFVELARLEKSRDELNIEWGQLQLEQSTWSDANRVEQVATRELGMVFPAPQDIVVIAR